MERPDWERPDVNNTGGARKDASAVYTPDKIGADTIYHSAQYPSTLTLPVTEGA